MESVLRDVIRDGVTDAEIKRAKNGKLADVVYARELAVHRCPRPRRSAGHRTCHRRRGGVAGADSGRHQSSDRCGRPPGLQRGSFGHRFAAFRTEPGIGVATMRHAPLRAAASALAVLLLVLSAAHARAIEVQRVAVDGVEAWLVEDHSNPMIAVSIAFRGGAALDPPGKEGLARMTASLIDEGAGDLDSQAFQLRLEELSITLQFDAGRDTFGGTLRTLSANRAEAFELLKLALTAPRFDPEPIERMRRQLQAMLRRQAEDPGSVANQRFFAATFPGPSLRPGGNGNGRQSRRHNRRRSARFRGSAVDPRYPGHWRRRRYHTGRTRPPIAIDVCRTAGAIGAQRCSRYRCRGRARDHRRRQIRPAKRHRLRPARLEARQCGFLCRHGDEPHPGRRELHVAALSGGPGQTQPGILRRVVAGTAGSCRADRRKRRHRQRTRRRNHRGGSRTVAADGAGGCDGGRTRRCQNLPRWVLPAPLYVQRAVSRQFSWRCRFTTSASTIWTGATR